MTDFHDDATHAGVTAAVLEQGRGLDLWSLALVVLALGTLLWWPNAQSAWRFGCLLTCVLAGMVHKIFAVRVAFDTVLFRRWAEVPRDASGSNCRTTPLAAVDQALAAYGVRKMEVGQTRDMVSRSRGALRLLGWQTAFLLVQFGTVLAAVAN